MTPDLKKSLALDLLVVAEEWAEARGNVVRAQEALKQAESRERTQRERFREMADRVLDAAIVGKEERK